MKRRPPHPSRSTLPVSRSVLALALSLLLLLAACRTPDRGAAPTFVPPSTIVSPSGSTHTAAYGSIVERVETRGRVVAKQEALLVFPLDGALKAVHVSPGDQVQAGAPLAELDAPQVAREVLERQFDLSTAELALARAQAEARSRIALAETGVAHARAEVDRAVSGTAVVETDVARARVALDQATAQVAVAAAGIARARAELDRAAAGTGVVEAETSLAQAQVAQAQAQIDQAQLQYDQTVLSGQISVDRSERAEVVGNCEAWCQLDLSQTRQQAQAANQVAQARVQAARAGLRVTQVGLQVAQAGAQAVQSGLQVPQAELQAAQALSTVARIDVQIARVDLQKAQARLSASHIDGQIAQAGLQSAQASLNLITSTYGLDVDMARERVQHAQALYRLVSEQLSSTQLPAPFPGIIISIDKRPGDRVEPYEPIGAIADPSELWVVATVLEEQVDRVTVGQPVAVRLDAYPDQAYTGSVLQIASQAIIWQGKSAYEVTIAFDAGQEVPATIRMGADVAIAGASHENVLLVPSRAIITIGGQAYVELVEEGGQITRVAVHTGVTNGVHTEIVSGLQAGQVIRIP